MNRVNGVLFFRSGPGLTCAAAAALLAATTLAGVLRAGAAPASAGAPVYSISFSDAPLADAVTLAEASLKTKIFLFLDQSDPSRKKRVTLTMSANEPEDMLNVLASAYGLRWLSGPKPEQVRLVSKRHYRGTPAGLRQSLADALEPQLRPMVLGLAGANLALEAPLAEFERKHEADVLRATAEGPTPLNKLDKELAVPLKEFLDRLSVFTFGNQCDRLVQELESNGSALFQYGPNKSGTRQFSFRIGNKWIACRPE